MGFGCYKKINYRLMLKKIRAHKGSVAILLTLLFLSIVFTFFVMLEGSGRMALRAESEASYDLAGRSILSMYDKDLFERYGLLAFQSDNKVLADWLESYANSTIETTDMTGGKSEVSSFETAGFSIAEPDNLMNEINEMMKRFIILEMVEEGKNLFSSFEEQIGKKKSFEDNTESKISSLEAAERNESESEGEDEDSGGMSLSEVIAAQLKFRNIINTNSAYESEDTGSDIVLRNERIINDLPSAEAGCKHNTAFSGIGSIITKFSNGISIEMIKDDFILGEYILNNFENHLGTHDSEMSLFHNEVEYILYGHYSDRKNYKKTHRAIFAMRMASNMAYLNMDPEKKSEIMTAAEIITPGPWAVLTQMLITVAWSSVEAVNDMKNLEAGYAVSLVKTGKSWMTDLDGIIEGLSSQGFLRIEDGGNMKYKEYLRLLLLTEDRNVKLYRVMDLIQINMKGKSRNDFLIEDHCIGFSFEADVKKSNLSHGFFKNIDAFKIGMTHTYIDMVK